MVEPLNVRNSLLLPNRSISTFLFFDLYSPSHYSSSTCLAKRATTTKTFHLQSANLSLSLLSSSELWFESLFYLKWIWHLIKSEKRDKDKKENEKERDKDNMEEAYRCDTTHTLNRKWCHLEQWFSTLDNWRSTKQNNTQFGDTLTKILFP